jgi:predicted secreted protein
MTELRATALVLVFSLILSLPYSYGSETVILSKDFNGREIKVRAGSTIQVELEQAGATGYTWELQGLDADYFEVLGVKTPEPKVAGDMAGAPILKTWVILVKKKGMSELKFVYYRPWEGEDKAAEAFVVKVRIL